VETIGQRAGDMSGRSVQRSLDVLKKHNYLTEIPDRRKRTHRRFVLAKPVMVTPTELVETPDSSVVPPPTVLSPNQDQRSRTGNRSMTKTTEKSSSSSSSIAPLPREGEESPEEAACEGVIMWCIDEAKLLFGGPIHGEASIPGRVRNLCQKYGAEEVSRALTATKRKIMKDGPVTWRYLENTARNQRDEGGAVSHSRHADQIIASEEKEREELRRLGSEQWEQYVKSREKAEQARGLASNGGQR
jgi:hypothetical protein